MRPALALLAALALAPVAAAAEAFTSEMLVVEFQDGGSLTTEGSYGDAGAESHGESSMHVEWSVEGTLEMVRGAPWNKDVYQTASEVRVVATGTYEISQVSRSSQSSGMCTLDFDDVLPQQSFLVVREGQLSMSNHRAVLAEWDCEGSAVMFGVPAVGFAASRLEDAVSGAFPAPLAVDLFLAQDEASWTSGSERTRLEAVAASGLVEGEAKLGAQTIPYSGTFGLGDAACSGRIDASHVADAARCEITSSTTLDIRASSFDESAEEGHEDGRTSDDAAGTAAAASGAQKDAPGAGILLALGALALALLVRRRA